MHFKRNAAIGVQIILCVCTHDTVHFLPVGPYVAFSSLLWSRHILLRRAGLGDFNQLYYHTIIIIVTIIVTIITTIIIALNNTIIVTIIVIIVMKAIIIIITFTSISIINIKSTLLCYHIIIMDTITAITIIIIDTVSFSIIIINRGCFQISLQNQTWQ